VLNRSGSMRAGQALSMSQRSKSMKQLKKSMIPKLYQSDPAMPGVGTVMLCSQGKPVMAGSLLKPPREPPGGSSSTPKEFQALMRSSSG